MNFKIDTPSFPEAICSTLEDKDFFFPKEGKQEAERLPQLRQFCGNCIHRKECLDFSLDRQIRYGFWGGATARERNEMLKATRSPIGVMAEKILHYYAKDMSVNEIAHKLDTSTGYVRRCISRYATSKGVSQSHPTTERDSS